MKDINKKIVKVEVSDYDSDFFRTTLTASFIHKSECTVVEEPKEHHPSRTDDLYLYFLENLDLRLTTYTINEIIDIAVKSDSKVEPKPGTPIGVYEGVEIFEDTKAWVVDTNSLKIIELSSESFYCWHLEEGYSKCYLTPEAVNARLKEEVIKKAKERTFSLKELEDYDSDWFTLKKPIDYAIELVEKEYNVKYL